MIYASICDYKTKEIPHKCWIILLCVGLIDVSLSSVQGMLLCLIPILLVAFIGTGGGDVKYATACGFVMGGISSLLALMVGCIVAIITEAIKGNKGQFAFAPYISIGFTIILLMKGFKL